MVYVVIGNSHSGKSSFVRNTWIRGREFVLNRDLMPYSELDDVILIGRYDTGDKRRDGTDSTERKQVGNYAEQILRLLPKGKDIVIEGMRCVSRPMMNKLLENNVEVKLIWIRVSPEVSYQRNLDWGTTTDEKMAVRHYTMCSNFVNDYTGKVDIMTIDSTNVCDFTRFSMKDLSGGKLV